MHERTTLTTIEHPFWYMHECIGAYLYGAEMAMRGETNLCDAAHFPRLDRAAEPDSGLEGVALDDPYQYPPQFLLLPRLALSLTQDVATIRLVWFALQATLFSAVAVLFALWIGDSWGRLAIWLLPLVVASFPFLHDLQFGRFHLTGVVLSVAGMLGLFAAPLAARPSWLGSADGAAEAALTSEATDELRRAA